MPSGIVTSLPAVGTEPPQVAGEDHASAEPALEDEELELEELEELELLLELDEELDDENTATRLPSIKTDFAVPPVTGVMSA